MVRHTQLILIFGIFFGPVTSHGYIHTDEQLARMDKEAEDLERDLDGLTKALKGQFLAEYKSLRSALDAYASAQAEDAQAGAGTGWADSVIADRQSIQKDFIKLFRKVESNELSAKTESEAKRSDLELNRIYQSIQKNRNFDSGVASAPSRRSIRETQRKWIQYRDAWLTFAALKLPAVSKHTLSTILTSERVALLKEIAKGS